MRLVKPPSIPHRIALAWCVLALTVAQILGGQRGYVCLCSGQPVPTQTSHCHGPHGADCHADESSAGTAHEEEGAGDREEHRVVQEDFRLRPAEAAPQLFAPQVLLAILPRVQALCPRPETRVPASYALYFGESPPFGVAVARTIVLLI